MSIEMDDDLLSIAFTTTSCNTPSSSSSSSSLITSNNNFHTFAVFNSLLHSPDDLFWAPAMDNYNTVNYQPSDHPDLHDTCLQSRGYLLEDVLSEFCSKRRRLLPLPTSLFQTSFKNLWAPTDMIQEWCVGFEDDSLGNLTKSDDRSIAETMKRGEEEGISEYSYSSPSSNKESNNTPDQKGNLHCIFSSEDKEKRKKRDSVKVVYPFAMVKPGGCEGDLTLNDINKRILMAPSRAVRHPVGDYACRPMISSPEGPGLSGKAVVAFTRIHTQGRGTITIIRTRG